MFCPKCGTQNLDGAKFCTNCGNDLSARVTTPAGQPVGNPAPAPNPAATATAAAPAAASTAAPAKKTPFDIAAIVAAAVMIVAFFMPLASISAFGYSVSMSPYSITFGSNSYVTGNITNFAYVLPGLIALIVNLVVKHPVGRGATNTVLGIATILYLLYFQGYINDNTYGIANVDIAYWALFLGAIVLIVCGVKTLLDHKKQTVPPVQA